MAEANIPENFEILKRLLLTHLNNSIDKGINWLLSIRDSRTYGWGRVPSLLPDPFSTADSLLVLAAADALPSDYIQSIEYIYKTAIITPDYIYWPRYSPQTDSAIPSPVHTAVVIYDLIMTGEDPKSDLIQRCIQWLIDVRDSKTHGWKWVITEGYPSPLATVFVLMALRVAGVSLSEIEGSVEFVFNNINPDFGWGYENGGISNPGETAFILTGLSEFFGTYLINSKEDILNNSILWLMSQQQSNGSFLDIGRSYRVTRNTSWSIITFLLYGANPFSEQVLSPISWLLETQEKIGYWSSDNKYSLAPSVRDTHDALLALITFKKVVEYYNKNKNTKKWKFSEAIQHAL
ncbi:prenyltransferase/squalene oxidase repeat-containing protein [Thermococcus sp. SY098]|uniref:prenyltransferase/squalene oxidase repeat-containing protein n=1 Tax=Thermococcus sp. SY098 TaxID=3111325 RepID=UPI002D779961|nr:prenyltransferase/squalene oxidase repeat-containing protein [Thermococcus sp. SY098]WRS52338.1 prenyltransferase/squalene oxidase repeat-containing protein [Thermococcus sp. SY098]